MPSTLVVYGTGEGQTATVAARVADALAARGHEVTTVDLGADDAAAVDADEFDAVVVGSPVRNRGHLPTVVAYVEANRAALADRPTGFLQVSMASALPWRWAREGAGDYVEDLTERTGWRPDRVALVAGAVRYTQYDPVTRLLFGLVSAVTTGDTDASRDYEYTDWDDVERFGAEFAAFVDGYLAARGEDEDDGADAGERAPEADATDAGTRSTARRLLLLAGALALAYWFVVRDRRREW
jgi:menaquinone-dependent protoporphyrinogen oxidase